VHVGRRFDIEFKSGDLNQLAVLGFFCNLNLKQKVMNILELKGGLHDLIAKVEDEELLNQMYEALLKVVHRNLDKADFWDELSPEQQFELEASLKASEDEANWVSHENVMKKYSQWLG